MIVALVALFVALSGSAAAVTVAYAKNADKVDGKHAVSSGASVSQRKGKLVATNRLTGQLPTNILPATNHHTVAGNSVALCASGGGSCAVGLSVATCPAGYVATGGGWHGEDTPPVDATAGYNYGNGAGWVVILVNNSALAPTYHAVAVCAPGTSSGSAARLIRDAKRQVDLLKREAQR